MSSHSRLTRFELKLDADQLRALADELDRNKASDLSATEDPIPSATEDTIPDELKNLLRDDIKESLGGQSQSFSQLKTMINSFVQNPDHKKLFNPAGAANPYVSVTFDKASILQILAQDFCEGIRFYFSEFESAPTLTLIGVDIDKKDLIFKKVESGILKIYADNSEHGTKGLAQDPNHLLIRLFPYI